MSRNEKRVSSVCLVDLISHQSLTSTEEEVDNVSKEAVAVQRVGTGLAGGGTIFYLSALDLLFFSI